MELVRFYSRIYQLPLQWSENVNRIELSGINDKYLFKYLYIYIYIYIHMHILYKNQNKVAKLNCKNTLYFVHKFNWIVYYDSSEMELLA